jgi:hypothetical protein
MRSIVILVLIAILLVFLNFSTALASDEWTMDITATDRVEIVTIGLSQNATNRPDIGLDKATTIPPGPDTRFTYLNLMERKGTIPLSKMINKDKMSWLLVVSINKMSSTTLSWNTSTLPPYVNLNINGIDMRTTNSLVLDGISDDSFVHDLQISGDNIPPVITNITHTTPSPDSLTITWDTDEEGNSNIKYGTLPANYTDLKFNSSLVTSHNITLTGLSQDTMYYFVVNSTDKSRNSNQSNEYSFKTGRYPPPGITGFSPASSVYNLQGTPGTFNITINQSVDVTWYINGMKVHNDTGVKASDYTNLSAVLGVWNVLATATNDNGTCMHIWIWNVTETWVVSMNLTLRPGWNHISIPVELLNDSVNSVFSGVQMRGMNVYRYRAIGFEAVTTIEPKVGYRVYSRRPITITITGNSIKNTLDLRAGWNLIGLPVNPIDPSVDSVFSDIQMCGENVYKYGSSGFESVNSVESKTGYWVYSRRPITITIEGIPVTS